MRTLMKTTRRNTGLIIKLFYTLQVLLEFFSSSAPVKQDNFFFFFKKELKQI